MTGYPELQESKKRMFSEYHIAGSHNSFLSGRQICTCRDSSAKVVKILQQGARMIELDLYGFFDKTWVTHGNGKLPCTRPLTFSSICEDISEFMTPTTSPLFIALEVNLTNDDCQNRAGETLRKVFGDQLVTGKLDLRHSSPQEFLGKVILTSGGGVIRGTVLDQVINVNFAREGYLMNRGYSSIEENREDYENLKTLNYHVVRCYPNNVVKSTNFDPTLPLELGVQFICMNYQTKDVHFKKFQKFFSQTDLIGYRLR